MDDLISRQAMLDGIDKLIKIHFDRTVVLYKARKVAEDLPSAQPERKIGHWILDRSGAYCCDNCMEPCAGYIMMKPRDKFCKMCGSRNEVME